MCMYVVVKLWSCGVADVCSCAVVDLYDDVCMHGVVESLSCGVMWSCMELCGVMELCDVV